MSIYQAKYLKAFPCNAVLSYRNEAFQCNPIKAFKNNRGLLLGLLVFTLIISVMNATMFNIVLPNISEQFQLSPSQASWIITGYMIVYAIGSVTYGKLTDRYSLKNLLTFGLLLLQLDLL